MHSSTASKLTNTTTEEPTAQQQQAIPRTPIANKQGSVFRSPAPSNKKQSQIARSPMVTTQMKMSSFQQQMPGIMASSEKWTVSPVCSRLREHITLLNGTQAKEQRLFLLQSPMVGNWPAHSPSQDKAYK
jgi:hypothetical protein